MFSWKSVQRITRKRNLYRKAKNQDWITECRHRTTEREKPVLESGTSELESGAKDSESVIETEITKQAGNFTVQGNGISIEGTAANGTEAGSGIEHSTPEENTEGNGVGCNMDTKHESSVKVSCGFKMEKPKVPRFAGDVRDYAIFRSDFKHAVDSRYSKRDAISLLRKVYKGDRWT